MALVNVEGDKIVVKTPYLPDFVKELKASVPSRERSYDEKNKVWIIVKNDFNEAIVKKLVHKYFSNLEEYILVAVCEGRVPVVGGLKLLKFGRDWHDIVNSELFHISLVERFGSCGSRKHPEFHGYVVAQILWNYNIKIVADFYRLFPKTPNNLEKITSFVKSLEHDTKVAKEKLRQFEPDEDLDLSEVLKPLDALVELLNQINTHEKLRELKELLLERVDKIHVILAEKEG